MMEKETAPETMLPEADAEIGEADNAEEVAESELISEGESAPEDESLPTDEVDYEAIVREDLRALARDFPEMRGVKSLTELDNPYRYAELRDLGLSPREAYLATSGRRARTDTRRHLFSAVGGGSGAPASGMTRSELEKARELFPGLGDSELMGLYQKVRA